MELTNIKSGWINEEKAIKYLEDLSANSGINGNYKRSLGRILNADVFKDWCQDPGGFGGVMAWFVSKKSDGVQFLAFEKMPRSFDYLALSDEDITRLRPNVDNIYFTTKGFSRGIGQPSFDFRRYLRTQTNVGDPINFFGKKEVISGYIENYLQKPELKENHSVPHGYLVNNWNGQDFFRKFLFEQKKEVKYIRYFFGFDPSEKYDRIRFFLIPVDENGKNIINESDNPMNFDDGNFLQNSWPPKPQNLAE